MENNREVENLGRVNIHRFMYLLITLAACGSFQLEYAAAEEINVAFLAMEQQVWFFKNTNSFGALAYAIEEVENDTSLLPGYNFR